MWFEIDAESGQGVVRLQKGRAPGPHLPCHDPGDIHVRR